MKGNTARNHYAEIFLNNVVRDYGRRWTTRYRAGLIIEITFDYAISN